MPKDHNRHTDEMIKEMHGTLPKVESQVDANSKKLDSVKEWCDKHSGEGTETTHSLIDKRLSSHSRKLNWIMGLGTGIVAAFSAFKVYIGLSK